MANRTRSRTARPGRCRTDRRPLRPIGGSIQSVALAAAYQAASQGRAIVLLDLLRAARDELAKSGKVAGRVELGEHYEALRKES